MRTAISPRLATNTFLNITPPEGGARVQVPCARKPHLTRDTSHLTPKLERNIPVLLGRVRIALVAQHLQRINQTRTRLLWLDHVIDVTAFCRDIGAGKFFTILSHQ